MTWSMWAFRWSVAALLVAGSGYAVARHMNEDVGGRYGQPDILRPPGTPRAVAVVFPDTAAPLRARNAAQRLAADGALVAVVDTARYLRSVGESAQLDCAGLADDAERLGKHLLRGAKTDAFQLPLLVGDGEGALLVRQAMVATAPDVLAGAVVIDGEPLQDRLACGVGKPSPGQGVLAVLPKDASGAQLAQAAAARFPVVGGTGVAALPLVEMRVPDSRRLAIVISGDGGWRDLDKDVGAELNRRGVSVVGWNSLRYFWSRKTPQRIADDLAHVINEYQRRWHVDDIALVGYSFGADVMPFAYQRLPEVQRRQVRFVSLLGLAHDADFNVRIGGWLSLGGSGQVPVLPELARMPPGLLQCIHGEQEKDTLCPELVPRGIEVVARPGGHHFDHDPARLATIILQGWQRRSAAVVHA
ncbi:MAG: AcvB/VirJ family lysyl-phosphatidylglycerol hydrolase [Pseudomonas sp.]